MYALSRTRASDALSSHENKLKVKTDKTTLPVGQISQAMCMSQALESKGEYKNQEFWASCLRVLHSRDPEEICDFHACNECCHLKQRLCLAMSLYTQPSRACMAQSSKPVSFLSTVSYLRLPLPFCSSKHTKGRIQKRLHCPGLERNLHGEF